MLQAVNVHELLTSGYLRVGWQSTFGHFIIIRHAFKCLMADTSGWLHVLIIIFFMTSSFNAACIFDSVKSVNPPEVKSGYFENEKLSVKVRRDVTLHSLFQPIRIRPQLVDTLSLSTVHLLRLQDIINKSIDLVSQLFSVIPVKGRLWLSRTMCNQKYVSGVNAGKCSSLRRSSAIRECKSYPEYCANLSEFQIPEDDLDILAIWMNSTSANSKFVVCPAGLGVSDADYILYINSEDTERCLQSGLNVIAYATYCQVNSYGRPIAGYINICPRMLMDVNYDFDKSTVTSVHELFHALGFSVDFFGQFKKCRLSGSVVSCSSQPNPVKLVNGVNRLTSPAVTLQTTKLFGSVEQPDSFGPVLQTTNGVVESHWDAAFMHSSLMTPTISVPSLMLLDNITLAYFEDTGWYRVNYTNADTFNWGRGKGRNFGLNPGCEQSDGQFFCQSSDSGCHYLHTYKGWCNASFFLHGCRVYRSRIQDSCDLAWDHNSNDLNLSGESFHVNSRCFLSNLSSSNGNPSYNGEKPLGRCYQHRCNDTGHLFVQVGNDSEWQPCPFGASIQVYGYFGVILCPPAIICQSSATMLLTRGGHWSRTAVSGKSSARLVSSTRPVTIISTAPPDVSARLELLFNRLLSDLINLQQQKSFNSRLISIAANLTGVVLQRFTDVKLLISDSTIEFVIQPSRDVSEGPRTEAAIQLLTQQISSGYLAVNDQPNGQITIVESLRIIDSDRTIKPSFSSCGYGISASVYSMIGAIFISGLFTQWLKQSFSLVCVFGNWRNPSLLS